MKPWVDGPVELLRHALDQMKLETGFGYRIAIICIDNAVELMIKTYLGLPKRVTNIQGLSRRDLNEMAESFPALLDALERHAPQVLSGIELGDIEWFHRLRNNLYHEGNGITVEESKVEGYAEIAKILLRNLFGENVEAKAVLRRRSVVGDVLDLWAQIESELRRVTAPTSDVKMMMPSALVLNAVQAGIINKEQARRIDLVRRLRNELAHGKSSGTPQHLEAIRQGGVILDELKGIEP